MAAIGVQPGWPDYLIIHQGKVFGLELKRVGGRLSRTMRYRTAHGHMRERKGQTEQFEELHRAGMEIRVAQDRDEVMGALRYWQIPLRENIRWRVQLEAEPIDSVK